MEVRCKLCDRIVAYAGWVDGESDQTDVVCLDCYNKVATDKLEGDNRSLPEDW